MAWSLVEIAAVAFGLACVVLTVKQHIGCWPAGLVQVVLYVFIFLQARLYAEVALHVVYVMLCVYGWVNWARGGKRADASLPVTAMSMTDRIALTFLVIAGAALTGYLMQRYTDASLPYPDAFVTVASLAAQWLLARKQLESWVIWIAVDVVAISIYLAKSLYLTAGLYAAFLGLAIAGFIAWHNSFLNHADASNENRTDTGQVRSAA